MTQPLVEFYDKDNAEEVAMWDAGVVDAGTTSPEIALMIWNNRGGETAVSDMQDTRISTTDNKGDTLDVVMEKWVECRNDSLEEEEFTQIGGGDAKPLSAEGQEEGIVKGTANNGADSDTDNFVRVTLRAKPPLNARAGRRNYKVRVSYYFT